MNELCKYYAIAVQWVQKSVWYTHGVNFFDRHVRYATWKLQQNSRTRRAQTSSTACEASVRGAGAKTRLAVDKGMCNYSRCGRMDKGVSALGQVGKFQYFQHNITKITLNFSLHRFN